MPAMDQSIQQRKPLIILKRPSKCATNKKATKVASVNVKVTTSSTEEETIKKGSTTGDETPRSETSYELLATGVTGGRVDEKTVKEILRNWKEVKIQSKRKEARLQVEEQIKNTAGFNDNMEAMHDFHMLIGFTSSESKKN